MVWHAHMLNPRNYLEDCILSCLNGLWEGGMPWDLVNNAIDANFNYNVSNDCVKAWENIIGRRWDNTEDPIVKTVKCPCCSEMHQVPWTTCALPEQFDGEDPGLFGEGYGDGNFTYTCTKCGKILCMEFLQVGKFVKDVQELLFHDRPMPGTILESKNGLPRVIPRNPMFRERYERTFPNRLIKKGLRSKLLQLLAPERFPTPTMDDVRVIIEEALRDDKLIKEVEGVTGRDAIRRYRVGQDARAHIRKMMSRYWGNRSPFALELGGAVLRQGIFTEKMNNVSHLINYIEAVRYIMQFSLQFTQIDWLHSPAARETMTRLITKYQRFVRIIAENREDVAVPTLDIDLAWHTHQLSPSAYTRWMYAKTQRLTDHDDKIDEDKLSTSFEWTSKTYQDMFGEVYSECTCWYCESVRAAHINSVGSVLRVSKNEKSTYRLFARFLNPFYYLSSGISDH